MSTANDRMQMEMDLVNRPNPWLPAYGFQITTTGGGGGGGGNANHYQPTHEDLRANDMMQGDFLETILEETSDDLQSDSDRSGTTYWLGSDSETESVIHIKAGQRAADGVSGQDGSGSECNSVVPKKRRRKNNEAHGGGGGGGDCSSSGNSSRSSSLLQFESLERTCASSSSSSNPNTVNNQQQQQHHHHQSSPPCFDSLESHHNRRQDLAASPDSLEAQDHHFGLFNGGASSLRPCRSFESLNDKDHHHQVSSSPLLLANGYAFGKNCDLSRLARRPRSRRRDLWHLNDVDNSSDYSDERQEDSSSNLSEPSAGEELDFSPSRYNEVDQLLVFGVDPSSGYGHTASVDCRNSVDLRDFGLDSDDERTRRESTLLDLKSGLYDSADELSDYDDDEDDDIDPTVQLRRPRQRRHHHHHHHHHPHRQHHHHRGSGSGSGCNSLQYSHEAAASAAGGGASFNFRFADKWRSAPSLPASLLESTTLSGHRDAADVVVASAASVPVSLELCGRDECMKLTDDEDDDDERLDEDDQVVEEEEEEVVVLVEETIVEVETKHVTEDERELTEDDDEMAKIAATMNHDCGIPEDSDIEPGKMIGEEKARMRKRAKELSSSVKTQPAQSGIRMTPSKINEDEIQNLLEDKPVLPPTTTVKTQDRVEKDVMEIAMAMENDVDEAIRQLTKEVQEANHSGNMTNVDELTAALESAQQMKQGLRRQRAKKNASYELAQQWNVDESNVKRKYRDLHPSIDEVNEAQAAAAPTASPRPRRPLNNASYELAQQHDWMKNLSFGFGKHIYRMDACEELPEPSCSAAAVSSSSQALRVSDIVEEMSGSASNLVSDNREPVPEMKIMAKSTENMAGASPGGRSRGAPRRQAPLEETSLLDQLKKNSDFSSAGGDVTVSNNSSSSSAQRDPTTAGGSPRPPVAAAAAANPDDEVDYPSSLLETKPIVICQETSYLSSPSPRYSRSCEDVQWRKESREYCSRREPPPLYHHAAVAADSQSATLSAAGGALLSSGSPASAREEHEEASTVQRHNEMSATAAKRLALSGEPAIRTTTSMNALNTCVTSDKEKKKSGFGGFLQRFSKLRFSGRSKVPSSEARVQKGKQQLQPSGNGALPNLAVSQQRKKTNEPDYIIIPLHPPADELRREEELRRQQQQQQQQEVERNVSASNGRPPVCKKPPLPPGSLRGVAASSASGQHQHNPQQQRRRAATDLGNPAAIEMAKSRMAESREHHRERPLGLLETDLDAPEADDEEAAAASKKARSLLNLNHNNAPHPHQHTNGHHHHHHHHHHLQVETLDECDDPRNRHAATNGGPNHHHHHHHRTQHPEQTARPHKSMEFLLDKENLHFVKPPENELQKVGERTPSEHELRVQRSLQRLNVPDWYKNSPAARDGAQGFRLKRHSDASQHATGWRALGSKTTSLSSLSSSSNRQPSTGVTNQNNVFDGEALLSPSPTPPVFSRWSTSLLNSAGSSPANSARSSFNHRQPYLGWRSQERLANPRTPAERLAQGILPQLQNAKQQQQHHQQNSNGTTTQQQPANQEVRNSIKEVTSAIVHYVQSGQEVAGGRLSPRDWEDPARAGARSTSPRGSTRLVWMESSFVGVRPMDSPEVPALAASSPQSATCSRLASPSRLMEMSLRPTTTTATTTTTMTTSAGETSEEGGSTPGVQWPPSDDGGFASGGSLHLELEDLDHRHRQRRHHRRDSQPQQQQQQQQQQASSAADPSQPQQRAHSTEPQPPPHQQPPQPLCTRPPLVRRRSEGSEPVPPPRTTSRLSSQQQHHRQQQQQHLQQLQQQQQRRQSFESASSLENLAAGANSRDDRVIKCRNSKCTNSTSMAEARRSYKSCHNCTCLYCSRDCRKAHWTRHRRVCLYSRASNLCIQVLSCVKKDPTSLKHVSVLARRGFITHGRGAVKCFFASPEAAEKFIAVGFQQLGEPAYVKWSDVLPSEMGAELYAEAVRLVESYNPETRLVVYVSVCVVREVPSSGGSVMWERQPVSRCAKLKLDPSLRSSANNTSSSATSIVAASPTPPPPANITREMESSETLVLTSKPAEDGGPTPRGARELGFNNIQKHLKQRGVSLRRHFPQVYGKLCSYVEGATNKFAPVTIYPRDQTSGRSFTLIIMLDAESEKLKLLPTDSSRVKSIDVGQPEQEESG